MGPPARVVSLVPSLTELVCWLGAADRLIGRTRFCVEPAGEVEGVAVVGGTKDPDVPRIVALRPDFVIANREENRREDIEALRAAGLDVLVTDPNSVDDAITMVLDVGARLACSARAERLATETRTSLAGPPPTRRLRVFVAVWKRPLMGLGGQSYGHDVLERAGALNVLGGRPRYPEVTLDEVRTLAPELVLLPDEPYRFRERDRATFEGIAPARLIDGKLLWWYGPRMPGAIAALRDMLALVAR
jgi:ABC-type Fe3+-hydroxamate transport system substrate-binding protein